MHFLEVQKNGKEERDVENKENVKKEEEEEDEDSQRK